LVEKQNEYERFENAVQDYRRKFDDVKSRLSSVVPYDGVTHSSVEVILYVHVIFVLC
jgi:hypothetical protein